MITRRYEITAGPSKEDLKLAVFDGKTVMFTLKDVNGSLESQVTGVSQYSQKPGSDEDQYRIEGILVAENWQIYAQNPDQYEFHGFFDCQTSLGYMDFQAAECWKEALDRETEEAQQRFLDEEMRAFEAQFCDDCGCPFAQCDCDQGTPDDAATDLEDSWSPVHGVALYPGHPDYDEPIFEQEGE